MLLHGEQVVDKDEIARRHGFTLGDRSRRHGRVVSVRRGGPTVGDRGEEVDGSLDSVYLDSEVLRTEAVDALSIMVRDDDLDIDDPDVDRLPEDRARVRRVLRLLRLHWRKRQWQRGEHGRSAESGR